MAAQNNTTIPEENNNNLVEERRKFIRLTINVEIHYSLITDSAGPQETVSKNISAGGICMVVEKHVPVGSMLQLEFLLPEDPPRITTKGTVAWIRPYVATDTHQSFDAGIEFVDISETDRKRINKYVFSLK